MMKKTITLCFILLHSSLVFCRQLSKADYLADLQYLKDTLPKRHRPKQKLTLAAEEILKAGINKRKTYYTESQVLFEKRFLFHTACSILAPPPDGIGKDFIRGKRSAGTGLFKKTGARPCPTLFTLPFSLALSYNY
jgi:hypothetical protein